MRKNTIHTKKLLLAEGIIVLELIVVIWTGMMYQDKNREQPVLTTVPQMKKIALPDSQHVLGEHIAKGTSNPAEVEIIITKSGFIPSTLHIVAGQQVQLINSDIYTHRIVSDNNLQSLINTDPLAVNQSFFYTFAIPGKYILHDKLNPDMYTVKVVVQ